MADRIHDQLLVAPGQPADLAGRDTRDKLGMLDKVSGKSLLGELVPQLTELQKLLWAEDERSLLLVLQGMDAAGKDGTIRSVFGAVNPQGVQVAGFKAPSNVERDHDFLWRIHQVVPSRGKIGIFNRSHYEDVVTVGVMGIKPMDQAMARIGSIIEFERHLAAEGTRIVKVFLHLSKDEQKQRFQERIDTPEKHWKFNLGDLDVRKKWDEFHEAYEHAITATSTAHAPWYVVPADRKWVRNVAIASLLIHALRDMDPQPPPPDPALAGLVIE